MIGAQTNRPVRRRDVPEMTDRHYDPDMNMYDVLSDVQQI